MRTIKRKLRPPWFTVVVLVAASTSMCAQVGKAREGKNPDILIIFGDDVGGQASAHIQKE